MSNSSLTILKSTAQTGRLANPYFRQEQLKSLHDILRRNTDAIIAALESDTSSTTSHATTECALTLNLIKSHYSSIDPVAELEAEYRIAKSKDAEDAREPWGVVYIEPEWRHTPFFNIVSALSTSLVAGNCVLLLLENTTRALPTLLRKLFAEGLESDCYAMTAAPPEKAEVADCLRISQSPEAKDANSVGLGLVASGGRVVAVVDRTANVAVAAENLVTARFSFGGTSPYAPDIVLVNEFVKKEFLEEVLKRSIPFLAGSSSPLAVNGSANGAVSEKAGFKSNGKRSAAELESALKDIKETRSWNTNVITHGSNGAILDLSSALSSAKLLHLPPKISHPLFLISSFSSLDHAIDLISHNQNQTRLLAAYHFAPPKHAKYLSQFIKADRAFVNHVPYHILLGPAAPSYTKYPSTSHPYGPDCLTRPNPTFITPPPEQLQLSAVLVSQDQRAVKTLSFSAIQEIKVKPRPENIAIGFFEQGIFIGLGLYGIPILSGIGAGIFFAARAGRRRWCGA
ncbi:Aldehyde/histidinol dehydrogenase [Clohesyomyces aquaticus]|uniref:Aldehyde/histidinol dehydrogenase n=1 Tax=Clohesyomyces aquaticus TaxID=1231657 RepID=A0A1Y2ABD0_9PLEO|nr:Aldehyde/histidinol dehydrogenase [Clohesyomyces aquaticus]